MDVPFFPGIQTFMKDLDGKILQALGLGYLRIQLLF